MTKPKETSAQATVRTRAETNHVKRYLIYVQTVGLNTFALKAGTIGNRLEGITAQLEVLPPEAALERLLLIQRKRNLQYKMKEIESDPLGELEVQFVACAARFSIRNSISYGAWREMGVPAKVLKEAGVTR